MTQKASKYKQKKNDRTKKTKKRNIVTEVNHQFATPHFFLDGSFSFFVPPIITVFYLTV